MIHLTDQGASDLKIGERYTFGEHGEFIYGGINYGSFLFVQSNNEPYCPIEATFIPRQDLIVNGHEISPRSGKSFTFSTVRRGDEIYSDLERIFHGGNQ